MSSSYSNTILRSSDASPVTSIISTLTVRRVSRKLASRLLHKKHNQLLNRYKRRQTKMRIRRPVPLDPPLQLPDHNQSSTRNSDVFISRWRLSRNLESLMAS